MRINTLFSLLIITIFSQCSNQSDSKEGYITTKSGLQYIILQKGTGKAAKAGDEVQIFETTSYLNGQVLYSNENTDRPVTVLIGGNQATAAMDEALRGMQAGEIRQIIAPPELVQRKVYPENMSPDSALTIRIILHKIL